MWLVTREFYSAHAYNGCRNASQHMQDLWFEQTPCMVCFAKAGRRLDQRIEHGLVESAARLCEADQAAITQPQDEARTSPTFF